jgi:hypothetical protein
MTASGIRYVPCILYISQDKIMADERIRKLRVSKEYLATHIANKKKKIKKVVAGDKLDRGATKRVKILKSLADDDSYSEDDDDDTSLHQEDLPKTNKRPNETIAEESGDDGILSRRYNNRRRRWEWETRGDEENIWEPKESFIDENGEEMEEFRDFEVRHPYGEDDADANQGALTQGSRLIFNHTKKLASAQVARH